MFLYFTVTSLLMFATLWAGKGVTYIGRGLACFFLMVLVAAIAVPFLPRQNNGFAYLVLFAPITEEMIKAIGLRKEQRLRSACAFGLLIGLLERAISYAGYDQIGALHWSGSNLSVSELFKSFSGVSLHLMAACLHVVTALIVVMGVRRHKIFVALLISILVHMVSNFAWLLFSVATKVAIADLWMINLTRLILSGLAFGVAFMLFDHRLVGGKGSAKRPHDP